MDSAKHIIIFLPGTALSSALIATPPPEPIAAEPLFITNRKQLITIRKQPATPHQEPP
jgi:hypothetical protein